MTLFYIIFVFYTPTSIYGLVPSTTMVPTTTLVPTTTMVASYIYEKPTPTVSNKKVIKDTSKQKITSTAISVTKFTFNVTQNMTYITKNETAIPTKSENNKLGSNKDTNPRKKNNILKYIVLILIIAIIINYYYKCTKRNKPKPIIDPKPIINTKLSNVYDRDERGETCYKRLSGSNSPV